MCLTDRAKPYFSIVSGFVVLYYMAYCSFGLPEGGIFEIELYGLQSWYTASLCHHNVLPKGISMKVPYGRARDHRVHHLHHHQHHLGRGPFWVLPICDPISSTVSIATNARPFLRDKE